ncbi:MAG: 2-oxo acid dehydrogenase subunit E2 [Anaerolineae bacterium]|nr:2-oxo acid dehydrogenase subunit E2 [Anaerolineae bacterium]
MAEQAYEVVMPKLGLIMTQAQLTCWHRQEGEWIDKGEILFSMEADKTALEIESPASGYLHRLVPEGVTIAVNTPIAHITTTAGSTTPVRGQVEMVDETPAPAAGVPVPLGAAMAAPNVGQVRATPRARMQARQQGIELVGMNGSGARGMVTVVDLGAAPAAVAASPLARKLAAHLGVNLAQVPGTGARGQVTREDVEAFVARGAQHAQAPAVQPATMTETRSTLGGLRAIIAQRLSASWNERPQVTLVTEIDASALVKARQRIEAEKGAKVSYNAFFMLALAKALREFPNMNASLAGEQLIQKEEINLGFAVDTERGLMVPVLKNVDRKDLFAIHETLTDLAQRTLAGRVLLEELADGTFTLTNLGAFGIDAFTPIINPPEAGILGVGRIAPKVVVIDGLIGVQERLTLSLSFDHRLNDGAPAARFLEAVAAFLENPVWE